MEDTRTLTADERTLLVQILEFYVSHLEDQESAAAESCSQLTARVARVLRELPASADSTIVTAMFDAERDLTNTRFTTANRACQAASDLLLLLSSENVSAITLTRKVEFAVDATRKRRRL